MAQQIHSMAGHMPGHTPGHIPVCGHTGPDGGGRPCLSRYRSRASPDRSRWRARLWHSQRPLLTAHRWPRRRSCKCGVSAHPPVAPTQRYAEDARALQRQARTEAAGRSPDHVHRAPERSSCAQSHVGADCYGALPRAPRNDRVTTWRQGDILVSAPSHRN